MKVLPVLAACLLLSACDSDGTSDYAQYYQVLRQSFAGVPQRITRTQAAAIPYASIGYRLNASPEQLLVLATDTGGEQLWTSGSHVVLVTRDGRIVRTVGLPHNVAAVTPQHNNQLVPVADVAGAPVRSVRLEDFPDLGIYGAPIACTASARGLETIAILGHGITTRKVEETCHSDLLNWSFTDSYWIDPQDGMVWRSIQHIGPQDETIETEILRPPG